MRLIGLTLCLLASSFGARAEAAEDRVASLEARVKALEEALYNQGALTAANETTGPGVIPTTGDQIDFGSIKTK